MHTRRYGERMRALSLLLANVWPDLAFASISAAQGICPRPHFLVGSDASRDIVRFKRGLCDHGVCRVTVPIPSETMVSEWLSETMHLLKLVRLHKC